MAVLKSQMQKKNQNSVLEVYHTVCGKILYHISIYLNSATLTASS